MVVFTDFSSLVVRPTVLQPVEQIDGIVRVILLLYSFFRPIRCVHAQHVVAKRPNRRKNLKFKYPKRFAHCVHISYGNIITSFTITIHDICTLGYTIKVGIYMPTYKQTTCTTRETSRACIKETRNALTVRLTTRRYSE